MKLTKLHRLDFRWVVASLPVIFILAGFAATPSTSATAIQSGWQGQPAHELSATNNEDGNQPNENSPVTGMAGESQPATVPGARWTAVSFCFGKDQSRKNRLPIGSAHALARNDLVSISPLSERTSLGRVSGRLCRLYTLVGLKPSGTS